MKLSCLQETLARGLSITSRVVPGKSTLPVLNNILMATDVGRLKLTATNLEMAVSHWLGARVEEEGSITLPSRLLLDFVSVLPKDKVDISLPAGGSTVQLACGRFQAKMRGISPDEFPTVPTLSEGITWRVRGNRLKEAINQVVIAAAVDDSRPVLAGALMSFRATAETNSDLIAEDEVGLSALGGPGLTMAAADGYRLAVKHLPAEELSPPADGGFMEESAPLSLHAVVPARALVEVARVIGEEDEWVELVTTPTMNQLLIRLKDTEIVTRLIDGQFPNFVQIIPKEWTTRAVINTSDLLQATRAATVFSRDNSMIVRIRVRPGRSELEPGSIEVVGSSSEAGDDESVVDASVEGEETEIAFNGTYLRDVLEAVGAPQVTLELAGPTSPGVVKPVGAEGYVHVVMPMATNR